MPPKAEPVDYGDELVEETEVVEEEPKVEEPEEPVEEEKAEEPVEEEKAEEPEEPEVEEEPKVRGIPKHRLDFAQQKRREAEERVAALEAELAKRQTTEREPSPMDTFETQMAELDLKIEQARLDGDVKTAAQLVGEQRKLANQLSEWRTSNASAAASVQATEQVKLDTIITQLEESFPQFVESSPEYDKDLVEQVLDLHQAFLAKGDRPSQAMAKASSMVLRLNGLLTDDEVTEEVAAVAKAEPKKTDIKKNVKAAKAQPPSLEKAGLDSDKAGAKRKLDISQMTIEEFEKLGDSEDLARARGDYDV